MFRMTNAILRGCALALPLVILHSSFLIPASGHPADISHLKVKVEPQRVEFRLTFNLLTLQQFRLLDTDEDGTITKRELDIAEKPLRDYLSGHVLITINGQDSDLGEARRMERMWPTESAGADVLAADFAQRFVDFTFVKTWQPLVEDVWIGFNIFKETGELHVVEAVFEQDDQPASVSFSQNEQEYLWDTGFSETLKSTTKPAPANEPTAPGETRGISLLVVLVALAAIVGTWMLLRKVGRIARGGFKIGPRE